MNIIKLLTRLQAFFNADEKEKKEKAEDIKAIIKKLKNKQRKIHKLVEECQDEELKKALQLQINIIDAQIKKGNEVLKQLKK